MGDYTKLIVDAEVRVDEDVLRKKVEELSLGDSAYHCSTYVESIKQSKYSFNKGIIQLHLCGQTKYGRNQEEFLNWLAPYVVQGNGEDEAWAIQFDEYSRGPVVRYMRDRPAAANDAEKESGV